jgi:hypothetical protein
MSSEEKAKAHLSKSQLEMMAKCPAQWELRYDKGIKRPPGVALVVGVGVHEPVEADLKNKMAWGELLEVEEIKQKAADATHRLWEEMDPILYDGDPNEGGAVDMVVGLATLHHEKVAPKLNPIAIERAARIEIPDGPYDIELVIDIEEEGVIRDTKTAKKKPGANDAVESVQGDLYTLEAHLRGKDKPFLLDFLVKTKEPATYTIESPVRTEGDHQATLGRIERWGQMLQAGIFPPTNPSNWWCSQKWCGYWESDCRWGQRKAVSVGLIAAKRLTSGPSKLPSRGSRKEPARVG